MRKTWFLLIMIFSLPFASFASVEFFALLPNPTGDDTLGEYIEIRNTGCQNMDIGGYHLYDASNKTYVIPTSVVIPSHENIKFLYATTKIALNNSGLETITLTDRTGIIIDTESYSGTQKDNVVIQIGINDDNCTVAVTIVNNTGVTSVISILGIVPIYTGTVTLEKVSDNTGIVMSVNDIPIVNSTTTGSIVINVVTTSTGTSTVVDTPIIESGALIIENTGTIIVTTGNTESSSVTPLPVITSSVIIDPALVHIDKTNTVIEYSSGIISSQSVENIASGTLDSIDVKSISTGTIISVKTSTGIAVKEIDFPVIFPTIQHPTNAIFTGGFWDCGTNQPCRINITFDPIFTGGLLAKNYICEVITATGILMTCNPNTLYFSSGSVFTFRITSKIDTSQSKSITWTVLFSSINSNNTLPEIGVSGSGSGIINTTIAGFIEKNMGESRTGSTGSGVTYSGVTFPEIIPTFQNYTNTIYSGDTLTCITSPCRVNFTLDPIFSGSYSSRDYSCETHYGTGLYDSCNPPQLYPVGTGSIVIILTHKSSGKKEIKIIEIIQNTLIATASIISQKIVISDSNPIFIPTDTNPPIAILEYDGKIKSYHEQIGEYEMNCYTLTCAVNLTAERSYDPEGGKVRFLWYYGFNDIKTTKDPGVRNYGLGDHEIWLRVIDLSGNTTSIRYYIHVLGSIGKILEIPLEKKKAKISSNELKKSKKHTILKHKKNKLKKMIFFDPPNIILQKSKFITTDTQYLCKTTAKNCSLNLTLSGSQKGITYTWIYDDGKVVVSKNPKSRIFAPGFHTIHLIAGYDSETPLWTQDIRVHVIKTQKPKKVKKVKVKKNKHLKIVTKKDIIQASLISPEVEKIPEEDIPYTTMALIGGIIPIILLRRFFTGVI